MSTQNRIDFALDEASPRDIRAPYEISYISQVRTQEARKEAALRVAEVYVGPDLHVATAQADLLNDLIAQITTIRNDSLLDEDGWIGTLSTTAKIDLPESTWLDILELDEISWINVRQESARLLNLIMRDDIRTGDITRAQRDIPRLMIPTLGPREREIVNVLVSNLIVPNTFLDIDRTQEKRNEASESVAPVVRTIRSGESIVREGEIVTNVTFEKLQVLGLLDQGPGWQPIAAEMALALLVIIIIIIYIARVYPLLLERPRRQLLMGVVLTSAAIAARELIPGHTLLPYLFPGAAAAMLIVLFLNIEYATLIAIATSVIVGLAAGGSMEMAVYILLGSLVGALALMHNEQLGSFISATGYLAVTNIAVLLLFRISSTDYDLLALLQLGGIGVLNAILASSLCFIAYSFTGRFFGITTSLQLMDLARPTHPLFRQLLIKAPGTYHHTILISNMSERAAEAIGADELLTRVGSYYHDIGKTLRPYFFVENQTDNQNPHDKLDPQTSAEIIIGHTREGLELARRYRIPDKVRDFIPEHHGTTLVTYFYRLANQASDDGEVDEARFRYPGPKPQSKETAIVMLADAVEAWSRANHPATLADMERVIRQVINDRLISGQLDETELTLKHLDHIRQAFVSVLSGVYHPRIQYPERTTHHKARATRTSS